MAHPAVKAGLCHCGFGGSLEFINAGIPIICLPHFGDQGLNAQIISDAGIGILLIDPKHAQRGMEKDISFDKVMFNAEKVYDSILELLVN